MYNAADMQSWPIYIYIFFFTYFPTIGDIATLTFAKSVWTQIRPDKMSGLIWIQTVWHSDGIPKRAFEKPDKTPGLHWNQLLGIDGIPIAVFFAFAFLLFC